MMLIVQIPVTFGTTLIHQHAPMLIGALATLVADQEYCTLSQCWGKSHSTRHERHNISDLHEDKPRTNLSKMFQHAVLAACKIGFEYIWVDALYIVQDEEEDCQNEAASMATVYARSGLIFAAAAASDGTEGCLRLRSPDMIRRIRSFKAKGTGGMYSTDGTHLYSSALSWVAEVERSPLSRRGRVFRKRAIAPRTLHFGMSQIYWVCGEMGSCEQSPNVIPRWQATTSSPRNLRAVIDRNEPWNS